MKRIISAFVIFLLLMTFITGCNQTTKETVPSEETKAAENQETKSDAQEEKLDISEKFTYEYMTVNPVPDIEKDPFYTILKSKFNIEIKEIPVTWDNWREKIQISVSTGQTPDITWTELPFGTLAGYAKGGVLRTIPDDLSKYPNLSKLLEIKEYRDLWEAVKVDGKSYFWPKAFTYDDPSYKQLVSPGNCVIHYRRDMLKAAGIQKKQVDTVTIDELIDICKKVIAANPGKELSGLWGPVWTFPWQFGISVENPYMSSYREVNGKYIWSADTPEMREGVKVIKKMYDEGILPKDFFAQKAFSANNEFFAGKLVMMAENYSIAHTNWFGAEAGKVLGITEDKVWEDEITGFFYLTNNNGKVFKTPLSAYWSFSFFGKNMNDKKFDRLLHVMDFIGSDEAVMLLYFGEEGLDYVKQGDNIDVKWKKDENGSYITPLLTQSKDPWFHLGGLCALEGIRMKAPGPNPKVVENFRLGRALFENLPGDPVIKDYKQEFFSGPEKDKYGTFEKDINDILTALVVKTKSTDEYMSEWDKWIEGMRPKVSLVLKELNDALAK